MQNNYNYININIYIYVHIKINKYKHTCTVYPNYTLTYYVIYIHCE